MNPVSAKAFALMVVWPILACVLCMAVVGKQILGISSLQSEVAARPPIAVVDVDQALYGQFNGGPADPATLAAAEKKLVEAARKLRAAGYIVLDAKHVYAYPKDFEAQP